MNMVIQRIFGTAISGPSDTEKAEKKQLLDGIRQSFHAALHDCSDVRAERVMYKINQARTPGELWLLRSDLHQCIAQIHSQSVAAERINNLIPVFEGLLPARQLSRI